MPVRRAARIAAGWQSTGWNVGRKGGSRSPSGNTAVPSSRACCLEAAGRQSPTSGGEVALDPVAYCSDLQPSRRLESESVMSGMGRKRTLGPNASYGPGDDDGLT